MTDEFMEAVINDSDYPLVNPRTGQVVATGKGGGDDVSDGRKRLAYWRPRRCVH